MKCIVLVKSSVESEAGKMPESEMMAAMDRYNQDLLDAGVMLGAAGLRPTGQCKRVRFSGSEREVIDGPFEPVTEQIAGYWIWEVDSMDHAIEWLKKCPNPMPGDSEIEIRPEFTDADFK